MNNFHLDTHSEFCRCNPAHPKNADISIYDMYCDLNPERFLFMAGNDFFIISYYNCLNGGDQYDFKKMLIEKVIGKYKIYDKYEVNRGVNIDKELKEFRKHNTPLRKYIQQVNYIYESAPIYAITTTAKTINVIASSQDLRDNYTDMRNYLICNNLNYLIPRLEQLYLANILTHVDQPEICKTIDHIVTQINKLIQ